MWPFVWIVLTRQSSKWFNHRVWWRNYKVICQKIFNKELGDNRSIFEDLPMYVTNLVWPATHQRSWSNGYLQHTNHNIRRQIFKYPTVIPILMKPSFKAQKSWKTLEKKFIHVSRITWNLLTYVWKRSPTMTLILLMLLFSYNLLFITKPSLRQFTKAMTEVFDIMLDFASVFTHWRCMKTGAKLRQLWWRYNNSFTFFKSVIIGLFSRT